MTEPQNDVVDAELVDGEPAEEKISTLRTAGKFVVKSSVRFVIAGAVASLLPEAETKKDKVRMVVGTYVISGMVAKQASTFIDEKFDEWKQDIVELPENINKIRAEMKKLSNSDTATTED